MHVQTTIHWLTIGSSIALLCYSGAAQQITRSEKTPLSTIIDGMEKAQAAARPQVSYQVIREYRLFGANNSKANSDVVVQVDFRPPASAKYRIQKSSGSDRGQQVVKRVLDHEVEAASKGIQARSALTRDNYEFTYIGETVLDGQPCYRLGLKARRNDKDLISGEAWVDKNSFFVLQVEGDLAKTPSWWLRRVHVRLGFAELEGTWLQTSMEAVADVRIVGLHTLTSQILDHRGADEVASTSARIPFQNRR
jgi:hypothetical protein